MVRAPSAQTLYMVTFKNADHVICRLKTFQRLSMAFRTKHKLLSMAHKALSHLAASSPTLLAPSLLPAFRFLNHQVQSCHRAFALLVPSARTIIPQICTHLAPSFIQAKRQSHLLREVFHDHHIKSSPKHSLLHYPILFSS